jgi:hypothetical protein
MPPQTRQMERVRVRQAAIVAGLGILLSEWLPLRRKLARDRWALVRRFVFATAFAKWWLAQTKWTQFLGDGEGSVHLPAALIAAWATAADLLGN